MRPIAALNLAPPTHVVAATALAVLVLHVAGVLGWRLKDADEPLRQRADLTVEFFTPAPVPTAALTPVPAASNAAPQPIFTPHRNTQSTYTPNPTSSTEPAEPAAPIASTENPTTAVAATTSPSPIPTEAPTLPMADTEADYKAAYLNNPRPPYPLAAVRQGAQGRVMLWAEVLPDGRAGRVRLEKSSGNALLDASAMNTVRSWRFTPARKDGVLTSQAVLIPIDFSLQDRR
jgi:protein TonB